MLPNPTPSRPAALIAAAAITVTGLSAAIALEATTGDKRVTSPVQRPARPRPEAPRPSPDRAGPAQFPAEFRTIDGLGNNAANPTWGAAAIQLLRVTPVAYADGLGTPAGPARPSARHISNVLAAQIYDTPNPDRASDYLWQWGQFLDHDIDETPVTSPAEEFDIPVPTGDVFFDPDSDGDKVIDLDRSAYDINDPIRQQLNNITAFIDASNVYGADQPRADALRTNDGTGRLDTSPGNLLPYNIGGFDNAPTSADPSLFLAGDIRANEQIALTAMHTLFVREHNFHADNIRADNPEFTGDEVYEHARAIVAAEMQAITYNEFLPVLLGPGAIPPYQQYDDSVNPGISNVFATAAYRVGHTMLSSTILRIGPNFSEASEGHIALLDCFFNPSEIEDNNIDSILRGLAAKPAQTIDCQVVDDVRNFLFGPPGAGGFDLAALNVQRGKNHGLASYNQIRVAFGRPAATTFAEINPGDSEVTDALADAYATPDDIDPWIGLLAEPHRPGALVGETLYRVLKDQFVRLRDGDRFWYEAYLPQNIVDQVNADTLAVIIRRNTNVGNELSDNVFLPPPPCTADLNDDGMVTVSDFATFAAHFHTNDPDCDFDNNGIVGTSDFAIFAAAFGTPCP